MSDQDLRHLLGRALAGEPPLRLDRDEVFRRGRRRVRNRRIAEAGAVVAAVVAIAIGAASVTGLLGTGANSELPPAATTTGTLTTGRPAPSSSDVPLTTTASLPAVPPETSERQAEKLTQVLADGLRLPTGMVALAVPGERLGPLTFRQSQGGYKAAADLKDPRGKGNLFIEVHETTARQPIGCDLSPPGVSCSVETYQGIPMSVITQTLADGEISYSINVVRPDGTGVYVATSNVSDEQRQSSGPRSPAVTRDKPPVDHAVLKAIAAMPGLTFA